MLGASIFSESALLCTVAYQRFRQPATWRHVHDGAVRTRWHPMVTFVSFSSLPPWTCVYRKLILFRLSELSTESDAAIEHLMAHVVLCSDVSLHYKYWISFQNHLDPSRSHVEAGSIAPFVQKRISRSPSAEWDSQCVHAMQLTAAHRVQCRMPYETIVHSGSGFLSDGTLKVSAEIKHMDKFMHLLQPTRDPAFCSIEFITSTTIRDGMNDHIHFGVASSKRRRRMFITHSDATIQSLLDVCPSQMS